MTIAVVVPFYQRSPGLLTRALRSVGAQRGLPESVDVRVVVVDDASPVSAASEVAAFDAARDSGPRLPVDVVVQPNAGPAAARNRALDALTADVRAVAFLDSDDEWDADHLARATAALDAGYDFYFADLMQPGQTVGAFERAGRIDADDHPPVPGVPFVHRFVGDMFDRIVTGNVIGTSTVVYDRTRFPDLRFDARFYSAGEDYLFWIACARGGARFCFSSAVEARYGYGVNVYAGSGWGTDGFLRRVHNEMRYRKRLFAFDLDARQRRFVADKVRTLRDEFAMGVLHRALGRQPLDRALLVDQLRLDPLTLFALPTVAGRTAAAKLRGQAA